MSRSLHTYILSGQRSPEHLTTCPIATDITKKTYPKQHQPLSQHSAILGVNSRDNWPPLPYHSNTRCVTSMYKLLYICTNAPHESEINQLLATTTLCPCFSEEEVTVKGLAQPTNMKLAAPNPIAPLARACKTLRRGLENNVKREQQTGYVVVDR